MTFIIYLIHIFQCKIFNSKAILGTVWALVTLFSQKIIIVPNQVLKSVWVQSHQTGGYKYLIKNCSIGPIPLRLKYENEKKHF